MFNGTFDWVGQSDVVKQSHGQRGKDRMGMARDGVSRVAKKWIVQLHSVYFKHVVFENGVVQFLLGSEQVGQVVIGVIMAQTNTSRFSA